jgi:murein DD-endopeptidase MepM/ murein hydrolase activator NlpD
MTLKSIRHIRAPRGHGPQRLVTAPLSLLAIPVVAMGIMIGGQPTAVSATAMTAVVGFGSTLGTDPIPVDPAADPSAPAPSGAAPQTTDPTASPPAPTTPDPTPTPSPTTPDPTATPSPTTPDPTPTPTPSAPPPAGPPVDPPVSRPTVPQVSPVPTAAREPSTPIPVRTEPRTRDIAAILAAGKARTATAERAAAAKLAAFTGAQARLASASRTYDAAKLAYASVKAEHDAALDRATLVHGLANDAARTAAASYRVAAAMVRALARQRGGDATVDVLLNGRGGGNLLHQLGTLDKLQSLANGLNAVLARADVDQKRADRLSEQDATAQILVDTIPVDTAFGVMASAEAEFDRATTSVEALRTSSDSITSGLIRLTLPPVIRDNGQLSSQGWTKPAVGVITDGFGPRPHVPLPGANPFHYATDIGAACGAGIYAASSGIVEAVGPLGTYGNWILIDHGDRIETGYAHISTGSTLVAVGESVLAGQVIAGVGSTGASTGCHLHFEVRIIGTRIDPQPFMLARGVSLGVN